MSSFFVTATSRSLSSWKSKITNPCIIQGLWLLFKSCLGALASRNSCYLHLFYQALFYCRIHLAKGRHCTLENVSNQYNIKAADYHFEADIMAVMIAADKAIQW